MNGQENSQAEPAGDDEDHHLDDTLPELEPRDQLNNDDSSSEEEEEEEEEGVEEEVSDEEEVQGLDEGSDEDEDHEGSDSENSDDDDESNPFPQYVPQPQPTPDPEPNFVPEGDADFENMTQLQKFDRYIRSDIPLQRLVYIKLLNETARVSGVDDTVNFILPNLSLISTDPELVIRQSVAEELGPLAKFLVVEDPKMGGKSSQRGPAYNCVINAILPRIKEMLTDAASEVRQAAGEALVEIAKLLDADDVGKCVLTMVLCMAHDDNDEHRTTAVPLMNELAPILGQDICRLFLAQEIVALSEDPSFRVKKATAQNFGNVCKIVGEAYSMERLLPAFVALSKDTIWSVRKGCVESLVAVSESVSLEKRVDTLMPMFESFAKDVSRWVRNGAYEVLGPFIHTLESDKLSPEFVRYYTEIPELSNSLVDSDVTFFCAYNFSAVALTLGPERWAELIGAYNMLVKDTKFKVRKTLSHSLHEIAKILGTELTEQHLAAPFETFLKDLDEVRIGVIKSISQFLAVLSSETRTRYLNTLWDLSMEPDQNWRFRQILAEQLKDLATLFSVEITINTIVPLTIALCDDRLDCIRKVAVRSLGNLLTRLDAPESKNAHESLVTRIRQFGTHKKFQRRQLYIEICEHLIESLPWDKFKSEFLQLLLERHKDPISNVRLALARLCRDKLLKDGHFKTNKGFHQALAALKSDSSIDVCFFLLEPDELEQKRQALSDSQADRDLEYIRGDNQIGSDLLESKRDLVETPEEHITEVPESNTSTTTTSSSRPEDSPSTTTQQISPSIDTTPPETNGKKQKIKTDTPRPSELLAAMNSQKSTSTVQTLSSQSLVDQDKDADEDTQEPPSSNLDTESQIELKNDILAESSPKSSEDSNLDANGDTEVNVDPVSEAAITGKSVGGVGDSSETVAVESQ